MTDAVSTKPQAAALAAQVQAAFPGVFHVGVQANRCVGMDSSFVVTLVSPRELRFVGKKLVTSLDAAAALAALPATLVPRDVRVKGTPAPADFDASKLAPLPAYFAHVAASHKRFKFHG